MKVIFSLILIFAAVLIISAQPAHSTWLTPAERVKFEQLRISGSEALYNLDYEAARKLFKEMADYHEELQKAGVLLDGSGLHADVAIQLTQVVKEVLPSLDVRGLRIRFEGRSQSPGTLAVHEPNGQRIDLGGLLKPGQEVEASWRPDATLVFPR